MTTPSLIRDYEDEFTSGCEAVKRDLQGLKAGIPAHVLGGGASSAAAGGAAGNDGAAGGGAAGPSPPTHAIVKDRAGANRNVANTLRRLRDVLSNLEIEAAQAPVEVRNEVKGRLAGYKVSIAALEKDAATMKKLSADADRDELLKNAVSTADKNLKAMGAGANDDPEALRAKQQLARNTQLMKQGSNTLREAEKLTVEMNDLADDTMMHLDRQRSTIQGISTTVRETDEELTHAQRILRKMHREMLKNKLILSAIIAVLVIMIIGILYYQFGRPTATHSDAAAGVSGGHDNLPVAPPPAGGPATWIPTLPPPPPDTTDAGIVKVVRR